MVTYVLNQLQLIGGGGVGRGGKRQCIINVFLCGAAEISPGGDMEGLRVFVVVVVVFFFKIKFCLL